MRDLLVARSLTKAFGPQRVLKGVDLVVRAGEINLLRGENGSGKTTLVDILSAQTAPDGGEILMDLGRVIRKHFRFGPGWRWRDGARGFAPHTLARHGIVRSWQENRLFTRETVRTNVAVGKRMRGENPFFALARPWSCEREEQENLREVDSLLGNMGLAAANGALADAVSLGQAKRIAILRAIRAGARLLFLDEPLASLDEAGIADMRRLFQTLVEDLDIALVIVEHALNIPCLLDMARQVWTLSDGKIVVESTDAVAQEKLSLHSTAASRLLFALRDRCCNVVERSLPSGAMLSILKRSPEKASTPRLAFNDLIVGRGHHPVIGWPTPEGPTAGLSLSLSQGDIAVLEAPNGWGKSTLFAAIAGLLPSKSGSILVDGSPVRPVPHERFAAGIRLFRPVGVLFDNLTVSENLALAGLCQYDEPRHLRRLAGSLSGGERQRLAWHTIREGDGTILLLDEPFAALDDGRIAQVANEISAMGDRTILVAIPSRRSRQPNGRVGTEQEQAPKEKDQCV